MKNKINLLIMLVLLLIPIKVFAVEYNAKITGSDVIYSKPDNNSLNERAKTSIKIDVSNLGNISHLELYVAYDNDKIGLSTCNSFNFIGGGCSITNDKKVYYIYNGYYEEGYPLYTVTFMPTSSTPKSGSTNVSVSFKNVKDKDGNIININTVSKKMRFDELVFRINANEQSKNDSTDDSVKAETTSKSIKESTTKKEDVIEKSTNSSNEEQKSMEYGDNYDFVDIASSDKKDEKTNNKSKKISYNKNIIRIVIAVIVTFLMVSLSFFIVIKRKDKKLDNMLDEFDKF